MMMAMNQGQATKRGTRWTGDGEGATGGELAYAAGYTVLNHLGLADEEIKPLLPILKGAVIGRRTNLALTGSPLTAEDVTRILSPEFRVSQASSVRVGGRK
jgi:hypothetical protein